MIQGEFRESINKCCCGDIPELGENNSCVGLFQCKKATKSHTILCGKPGSSFPLLWMVGPDYPITILVWLMMFGVGVPCLYLTYTKISYIVFIPMIIMYITLLIAYAATSCSDPGIIYINTTNTTNTTKINPELNQNNENSKDEENIELSNISNDIEIGQQNNMTSTEITATTTTESNPPPASSSSSSSSSLYMQKKTIECSLCEIQRPLTASHCHYCGSCIDGLDHHCPWSGQCIGKKNMAPFQVFVCLVGVMCWFCVGTFIYSLYIIAREYA